MSEAVDLALLRRAIRHVRKQISWKPGKAQAHLDKRISRGHLEGEITLEEYKAIITTVLFDPNAVVYVYRYGTIDYPTVVAPCGGQLWLVMVGPEGIMETAFPPDDTETYFSDPRYIFVGKLKELL